MVDYKHKDLQNFNKRYEQMDEIIAHTEDIAIMGYKHAKEKVLRKDGKIKYSLLDKKENQKDFAKHFTDYLYEDIQKRFGKPEDAAEEAVWKKTMLESYHGINMDTLEQLLESHGRDFTHRMYISQYMPRHLERLRETYLTEHVYAPLYSTKEVNKILDEVGAGKATKNKDGLYMLLSATDRESRQKLGRLLVKHRESGAITPKDISREGLEPIIESYDSQMKKKEEDKKKAK